MFEFLFENSLVFVIYKGICTLHMQDKVKKFLKEIKLNYCIVKNSGWNLKRFEIQKAENLFFN